MASFRPFIKLHRLHRPSQLKKNIFEEKDNFFIYLLKKKLNDNDNSNIGPAKTLLNVGFGWEINRGVRI